jgi:hypothetical protein
MPQTNAARPKHRRTHYFVASGLFDGLESFADLEVRSAGGLSPACPRHGGDWLRGWLPSASAWIRLEP